MTDKKDMATVEFTGKSKGEFAPRPYKFGDQATFPKEICDAYVKRKIAKLVGAPKTKAKAKPADGMPAGA